MMLALLLARAGVDVVVLEKHADFLRDFRGDTVHPSTLELMHELHILDAFLKLPHQEIRELSGQIENEMVPIGDFTHLPTHCKFVALMPQWDFLDFIKEQASRYTEFHLTMQAEVIDLIEENGRIAGVRAKTQSGPLEVRAPLTIGADGRHSIVRERAGLKVIDLGAPMDVLWMRISRRPTDREQTFGHLVAGKMLVLINRGEYWQCAFVIPKGKGEEVRQKGLESFREQIISLEPFLRNRVTELRNWKQVRVLTVAVDRLSNGLGQASCVSAMLRTRCHRLAASASILRSKMRWPPQIFSQTNSCGRIRSAVNCRLSNGEGISPPALPSASNSLCKTR